MSNYKKPRNDKENMVKSFADKATVIAAIIGLIGTIITAVFSNYFSNWLAVQAPISATQTAIIVSPTIQPSLTATVISPSVTPSPTPKITPIASTSPDIAQIESEITQLRIEVDNLQKQVATLSNSSTSSEISAIQEKINSIDTRIGSLEQVILDNPVKALSLTLLERDFANLQQRYQSDIQSLRDEIGRLYGLNQWFLGILIPVAISVVGLAIRNFFSERDNNKEKAKSETSGDEADHKEKTA